VFFLRFFGDFEKNNEIPEKEKKIIAKKIRAPLFLPLGVIQ
jgi:hypothetical protein